MDSVEKEKAALIAGIEADARAESEKIIAEARTRAAEKKKYAEKKVESMLNDARQKAAEQAEAAKKKIVSGAQLEAKRRSMRVRNTVIQDILELAENKMNAMSGNAEYRSVLVSWIAEAAVGLDAEAAQINASQNERPLIDDKLLAEVADRIHERTDKRIKLTLSGDQPLKSQGIILTAADGRTAFNNLVKTRMLRKQREIRTMIYDALFGDSGKE